MDTKKLQQELKTVRKAAGFTQRELAEETTISFGTVAQYEARGGVREYIYRALIDACKRRIVENQQYVK